MGTGLSEGPLDANKFCGVLVRIQTIHKGFTMTTKFQTIGQIIINAEGSQPAFSAPDRDPMTFAELVDFVGKTSGALVSANIKKKDAVAIVLPNGPEAATAFISIANCATAAPLNPAYKFDEFVYYLKDLNAKLLLCSDPNGFAATAAQSLNIPVCLTSVSKTHKAGQFDLDLADGPAHPLSDAQPDDVCLVLHTSGTTSRPKLVPLSHRNVTASARNVADSLGLSQKDICLNVMPLFHIHGLIAAVLGSLSAGGSIYCSPGFNALKVYAWLIDAKSSWYTAVPTMHQAIVARAARNRDAVKAIKLRFARSSSSSLPPQVMADIESTFGCPVVEAYGMTEAAHQMTCNPIASGSQKPGSVGVPAGPDVAIMTSDGVSTTAETLGEIVIRGENVTSGYLANDTANSEAFVATANEEFPWFRTGDQGRFDEDGYLFITGRLKEIINRGGEKISPREVDEVLMDHDAVEQAVTFAVKHSKLGEDVAAAVVLKDGKVSDPQSLRNFVAEHLAAFKVPRQVIILEEIPKGPTGKLQRIGLAEKLGLEVQK
jgi:acyl-CoA synthetase (AMP-forming)/AMP-acid ligase II